PPTFGFVAKEGVYSTLLASPDKASVIAFIGIMIGSILTVAYSARFRWGASSSRPRVDGSGRRAEKPTRVISPLTLTALTLALAPGAGRLDGYFTAWTSALPAVDVGDGNYH